MVADKKTQARIAELEAMLEEVNQIGAFVREFNQATNAEEILDVLTRPALEAGATEAILMFIDLDAAGEPEWLEAVATIWKRDGAPAFPIGHRIYAPEFPITKMWHPQKPFLVPDTVAIEDKHFKQMMAEVGNQAIGVVPFSQGKRWVGMLFISWTEPHEFSEQAVRFYETIATLATPTIANLRLLQQQTEQLAFNQSLFEAFIDNFPALVFAKDTEGKIILANKALEAFFDRPKDELLGKTVHDLASKEAADAIWASEEQVIRNNETSVVEEYAPRPDGTVSARLSTKFPIRDAEGNATGVGGVAIDISEQKAAQAALEEAMQTSADIVSAIPSGLFIYQYEPPDQLILMDANPAAEELTGIALVDWLGREFNEIWADATERGVIDEYLKVAQTGEIYEAEEVMYEGNRVASAILTRVFPMPGDRIGVAFEDVTDQKTSEVERARLQEDIIEAQQRAIQELSTPIIPVMEGIIVMPVVGNIDTQRARQITRSLLAGVSAYRVNIVILDLTGVSVIDSGVANHLNKTIMAARLKGAQAIITGISDAVAESVVDLGIDWGSLETFRDLQTGLIAALANVGFELKKRE